MSSFARKVRVRGIIQNDGKVLFVRGRQGQTYWALPGGGLEAGESLEQGLAGELVEELGVEPADPAAYVLPDFLKHLDSDIAAADWPKLFVRRAV